ncbi:MAG: glutamate--tRNA ligase [Bacteroidetes bacterium]|nr:MAG: glutamate--tRNA ligase [Bacteroidota bacterium]
MAKEVRVRFAPSPTGGLHIGGARTALYNYLYARKMGGKFILRIEDTDQSRKVEGAEQYIAEALEWCGIIPDESPSIGGDYGPYRQSERLEIYVKYVKQLLESGNAYYAFDTTDELTTMREKLQEEKADLQQYGITTRMNMRNSLTLGKEETDKLLASGTAYVVRLKVPENQTIIVNDKVRGEVSVDSVIIDDKILLKSDGFPTYHLANVVDDHLMKISHVIRGEEWLPSAPLHVLLYQLFGWQDEMPEFAHLPLLLKPEGSGKLSKRDADKHGFPIFPIEWHDFRTGDVASGFREQGYLPEALINFLALLGWNPGTEEEVFDLSRLSEIFELSRINKAGAKFDIDKAKWYNQIYLRKEPIEQLADMFMQVVEKNGYQCNQEKAAEIISLLIERATFFDDFWNQGSFFFVIPTEYDEQMARKKWNTDVAKVLSDFSDRLTNTITNNSEDTKQALWEVANEAEMGIGKVMPGLRLAMTGSGGGPDLMGIIKVLGAEETRSRIQKAIEHLG